MPASDAVDRDDGLVLITKARRSRHAVILLFITCACPERDTLSIGVGKERAVITFRIG